MFFDDSINSIVQMFDDGKNHITYGVYGKNENFTDANKNIYYAFPNSFCSTPSIIPESHNFLF